MRRYKADDGMERHQRWRLKPADTILCPECGNAWQRTNQQRQDGTRLCSQRCVGHAAAVARMFKATKDAASRYASLIRKRLHVSEQQARDVEVVDIVRLMLEARRDGLALGRMRGIDQRGRYAARKAKTAA